MNQTQIVILSSFDKEDLQNTVNKLLASTVFVSIQYQTSILNDKVEHHALVAVKKS